MVNISMVTVISNDTIQLFNGFDQFWKQVMENIPASDKAERTRQKQDLDQDAIDLAYDYGLNPARMANIIFVFTTYERAKRELEDYGNKRAPL